MATKHIHRLSEWPWVQSMLKNEVSADIFTMIINIQKVVNPKDFM